MTNIKSTKARHFRGLKKEKKKTFSTGLNRAKARLSKGDFRGQNNTSKGVDRRSVGAAGELALLEDREHVGKWLENRSRR